MWHRGLNILLMPFQNEKRCSSELNKYASVERLKVGEITDVLLSQGWLLLLRFFLKQCGCLNQEKQCCVSAVPTSEESHLEPGGHVWNHFSISAIYCNALQMLPVVCMCMESFLHEQSESGGWPTCSYQQVKWMKHTSLVEISSVSFNIGLFPVFFFFFFIKISVFTSAARSQ